VLSRFGHAGWRARGFADGVCCCDSVVRLPKDGSTKTRKGILCSLATAGVSLEAASERTVLLRTASPLGTTHWHPFPSQNAKKVLDMRHTSCAIDCYMGTLVGLIVFVGRWASILDAAMSFIRDTDAAKRAGEKLVWLQWKEREILVLISLQDACEK
jgi:hypothetical protein